MLRLTIQKEPYWIDIQEGIRLKVKPLTTALMSAAHAEVRKQIQTIRTARNERLDGGDLALDLPNVEDDSIRFGLVESILAKSLALQAILEWEGVLLPREDTIAPITPQTISDLMDIWFVGEKFTTVYIGSLNAVYAEGNASKPVANGISAAVLNTVEDATLKSFPVAEESLAPSMEKNVPTQSMSL